MNFLISWSSFNCDFCKINLTISVFQYHQEIQSFQTTLYYRATYKKSSQNSLKPIPRVLDYLFFSCRKGRKCICTMEIIRLKLSTAGCYTYAQTHTQSHCIDTYIYVSLIIQDFSHKTSQSSDFTHIMRKLG